MDVLLFVRKENYGKVREKLLKDEKASLLSITFRDAKNLGKEEEGYYCHLSGSEEYCKRALEIVKDLAEEVEEQEKEEVLEKIKEEEKKALEGFGALIG